MGRVGGRARSGCPDEQTTDRMAPRTVTSRDDAVCNSAGIAVLLRPYRPVAGEFPWPVDGMTLRAAERE